MGARRRLVQRLRLIHDLRFRRTPEDCADQRHALWYSNRIGARPSPKAVSGPLHEWPTIRPTGATGAIQQRFAARCSYRIAGMMKAMGPELGELASQIVRFVDSSLPRLRRLRVRRRGRASCDAEGPPRYATRRSRRQRAFGSLRLKPMAHSSEDLSYISQGGATRQRSYREQADAAVPVRTERLKANLMRAVVSSGSAGSCKIERRMTASSSNRPSATKARSAVRIDSSIPRTTIRPGSTHEVIKRRTAHSVRSIPGGNSPIGSFASRSQLPRGSHQFVGASAGLNGRHSDEVSVGEVEKIGI